jgi:glycosyltransferase involved in cell wall biosynthesis
MSLSILAVVPLPPWRTGAAVVCAELLRALAARGHRIRALAPVTPDAPGSASPPAAGRGELCVSWFPVPYFAPFDDAVPDEYRRLEGASIHKWLRECIAAERPDVLVVGRGAYGLHVPTVARDAGLPCLLISHGGPAGGVSTDGSWSRIVAALADADLVVAPARHWAEVLGRLGLPRVAVIPNPVDHERFAPRAPDEALARDLRLGAGRVVVMHASNLQAVKRPMDLVASAERALRLDSRLVYVVVGDGPNGEAMVAACRRRGLGDHFRFVGWVPHERMPALLGLADVVVMMSEQETQSLLYLEAQASGRVLLSSDVPGAREVVADGETGVLYRSGDVEDLARRTAEIAGRPAWRAEVGRAARERVAAHALPVIAARYERTLEALARGAPVPG